jgi:hypothetical protein
VEYSLWDVQTNRYLGCFEDEKQALELVRKLVNHYGPSYAEILDLGVINGEGEPVEPLSGASLIARVEEVLGHPEEAPRDELIASPVRPHKGLVSSIEPIAASAKRRIGQLPAASQRRGRRG